MLSGDEHEFFLSCVVVDIGHTPVYGRVINHLPFSNKSKIHLILKRNVSTGCSGGRSAREAFFTASLAVILFQEGQ